MMSERIGRAWGGMVIFILCCLCPGCATPPTDEGVTEVAPGEEFYEGPNSLPFVHKRLSELRRRWDVEPIPVGTNSQVFYDDAVIASMYQVERHLGQVSKLNEGRPVIYGDRQWEMSNGQYVVGPYFSVIRTKEGMFQCWYGSGRMHMGSWDVGYAESPDGIHWDKPVGHSVFYPAHGIGVLYDEHDPRASHRYKMVYGVMKDEPPIERNFGLAFAHSRNGITWKVYSPDDFIADCRSDTQSSLFWDPELECYRVCTRHPDKSTGRGIKQFAKVGFGLGSQGRRSDAGEQVEVLVLEEEHLPTDGQSYSFNVHKQGDLYIGKMTLLHRNRLYCCVAVSRDGRSWDWQWIGSEHNLIPRGLPGAFDGGSTWFCSSPFIEMGDKQWIYYAGTRAGHGYYGEDDIQGLRDVKQRVAVGVVEMRRHGLFYLTSKAVRGVVETKAFVLDGRLVRVNVDASLGSLAVAVLDERGLVLDGFSAADCEAITQDGVDIRIDWKSGRDLSELMGRSIKLRFELLGPIKLYSFTVAG